MADHASAHGAPAHGAASFPHPLYEKYVLQPFFEDAQKYYYEPMLAANKAHTIMLMRQGIISADNARALLSALKQVEAGGVEALQYQSGVEDLFFAMERKLISIAGAEHGGNLQLARSRNDLGYALTRLAMRPVLLDVMLHLLEFRQSILTFAYEHLETIMPGYTHTQPAQPTTMAHYMAGVLSFLERDFGRFMFAYRVNNQSPLGAAALTGTGFPIDRDLSAAMLGFDGVMASTYDSIGSSDNLTDAASAVTSLAVNLSRFTKDMLFWATQESGAIRIDDSFIQISSIMPQKRNPVVLEHLRSRISRAIALAHGVVIECHNIPFGDTQDIEDEIMPLLFGALETSQDILHLYGAVIQTLHVNVEHLHERAIAGFTTVTELADTLVREAHLPFRQAHSIVSGMVTHALQHKLAPSDLTPDIMAQVSREKIGREIVLSDESLKRALDPIAFVHARDGYGGSAPSATKTVLDELQSRIFSDRTSLTNTIVALKVTDHELNTAVDDILTEKGD